ncbi:lysophospholipid acyltransferase family protein [Aliikangiella coralliicola]|uniref:1-acyl-sn-glycerol-3-phosphate acyltransferase n=1 Tax=Aliikangiella coralliicola TaxID=2592383 RepID=A0A545UAN7_9GAMM|nr:lysophospholipid acyltransferase family protein [Aliikangiella coralliicola]TQV86534.1 1-acyl-sn-glycerol-3-phosphate acyltransferase [Aliikangiella coralliicola]
MTGKKASKLRFCWIAFMTGVFTFWYSMKVILGSFVSRDFRTYVNKTMYRWAEKLLGLIQVKVNVIGLDNMPSSGQRPVIVMCNHSSLYDIPISAVALNTSLRMLTKKELFKIPVFATALRKGEFVSVDRNNREQSRMDLKIARQKMLDGIILWVAPEGTRSKDGKLAKFKRGGFHLALDTEALIVPMVIKDIHKVQAGDDLTLYLGQEISVEVCKPIDAAEFSVEERRALVSKVRNRMLSALDQPCESEDNRPGSRNNAGDKNAASY